MLIDYLLIRAMLRGSGFALAVSLGLSMGALGLSVFFGELIDGGGVWGVIILAAAESACLVGLAASDRELWPRRPRWEAASLNYFPRKN